jgi:type IV pilus assembly protein PilN
MMQFNLLPHRAQQQWRRRQSLYGLVLLAALLGCALTGSSWYAIGLQQQVQQTRNQWLQQSAAQLSAEIKYAAVLQLQIDTLAADAEKIETWRYRRDRLTRFLTMLSTQTPAGIYLQKVRQQAQKITLDGYAGSNQEVTELLQNLNAQSDDIASAQLLETRAANQRSGPALAFSVALTLRQRS